MVCQTCKPWTARNQRQLDNRLANMGANPQVTVHTCPSCGRKDWATTTDYFWTPDDHTVSKKWSVGLVVFYLIGALVLVGFVTIHFKGGI